MIKAFLFAALLATPAFSQSAFDDFMAKEKTAAPARQQQSEALRKFSEILNGGDRARALDALAYMLARKEPAYYNFATEFGVFSSDPEMRNMALHSLLDRRRQHRLILDLSKENKNDKADQLLRTYKGVSNPGTKKGYITVTISPFDPETKCWKFAKSSDCAFILTGDSISLRDWGYVTGNLELDDHGAMVGMMTYQNGDPIPVSLQMIYQ